jgi:PAS domain S-box-containing protein
MSTATDLMEMKQVFESIHKRLKNTATAAYTVEQAVEQLSALCTNLTNKSGVFLKVSPSYCKLVGYTADELVGQHFTKVVPKLINYNALQMNMRLDGRGNLTRPRYNIRTKSGVNVPVHVTTVLIYDNDGNTFRLAIVEPITVYVVAQLSQPTQQ